MWVTDIMPRSIRAERDLARPAARERRLRLVMQILSARQAESERAVVSRADREPSDHFGARAVTRSPRHSLPDHRL